MLMKLGFLFAYSMDDSGCSAAGTGPSWWYCDEGQAVSSIDSHNRANGSREDLSVGERVYLIV
jgi:hypothetical protein